MAFSTPSSIMDREQWRMKKVGKPHSVAQNLKCHPRTASSITKSLFQERIRGTLKRGRKKYLQQRVNWNFPFGNICHSGESSYEARENDITP